MPKMSDWGREWREEGSGGRGGGGLWITCNTEHSSLPHSLQAL